MALARTKLGPPPLAVWHLSRGRLLGRMDATGSPLVLVSAPAGYGKTSLLAEWARSRPGPTAWLALDAEDDDPARLAAGIEAAIEACGKGTAPSGDGPRAAESIARIVDLMLARPGLVLVLDDVHLIKSKAALGLLSCLAERLPEGTRLAMAARSDPALPLARLRAAGRLAELGIEELRLSPAEGAALAASLGAPELGPEESALLQARTEGWAAGLALAARFLAARASAGGRVAASALLRDARAADRWALDYLLEEVVERVSPEVEDFLARTSVLDGFSAELAQAVAGGPPPGGSLRALAREALFLAPADEAGTWWRYHPLFAELLLHRLRETRPGLEPGLRLKAAAWLEAAGSTEAAAAQFLAAGEPGRAAELLEAASEGMMARGELDALLGRIDSLPAEVLESRPALRGARAWCLFFRGRPVAEFLGGLDGADAAVLAGLARLYRGEAEGVAEGMAELLARRGSLAPSWAGRYMASFASVLALFETGRTQEAAAILEGLRADPSPMLRLGAVFFLATALYRGGELSSALALVEADLAEAGRRSTCPAIGRHLMLRGEILLCRGRMEEAEADLVAGIARLERLGAASSMAALLLLARLRSLRGEEAVDLVERARRLARDFDLSELDDRSVLLCEARIAMSRGDLTLARRVLDSLPPPPADPAALAFLERHPAKYERLEKARLLILERRPSAALALLDPLREIAMEVGRRILLVDLDFLRGLALEALGRGAEAGAAVESALGRAAPEGILLPFLEGGEPGADLLSRRLGELPPALSRHALSALASLGVGAPASEGVLPADREGMPALSSRERDVLALLASELSAAEIGERLYLSENTVKSHLKTLYAKLGAHTRAAAWARAAELGLLPPGRR